MKWCIECGENRAKQYNVRCAECLNKKIRAQLDRKVNITNNARINTAEWAIQQLKEKAKMFTWAGNYKGCIKISKTPAENFKHKQLKFLVCDELIETGHKIFTEFCWDEINGNGRSDIVAVDAHGEILIHEIVSTERDASLWEKETKYPYPIKIHRVRDYELGNNPLRGKI